MSRFDYVKYDDVALMHQEGFKNDVGHLENKINTIGYADDSKASARAKAVALTKLEECYMWIGKAIRDDQIARNGSAELQEERTNS